MKAIRVLAALLVISLTVYLIWGRPSRKLEDDPEIQKYALVNAQLAVAFERVEQDSVRFAPIRDSILREYGVGEEWLTLLTGRLDQNQEDWPRVYDLMIQRMEKIRDSLLHRTPLPNDSTRPRPASLDS